MAEVNHSCFILCLRRNLPLIGSKVRFNELLLNRASSINGALLLNTLFSPFDHINHFLFGFAAPLKEPLDQVFILGALIGHDYVLGGSC